jgi:dCMP deaminase
MGRPNWEEYALIIAEAASSRSEDPFVKVGACALRHDNSVASVGYNGAPPGKTINWENRDERRAKVSHAENSCLRYIKPGECRILAVTESPCPVCLIQIVSYGIETVVFKNIRNDFENSLALARELGITLKQIK